MKPNNEQQVSLIIPAAGSGKRFGSPIPKQYIELRGIPILARTLLAFERVSSLQSIIIAASPDYHDHIRELAITFNITKIKILVAGGSERQDSIRNALHTDAAQLSDIILVHDAVRPFITPTFVQTLIDAAYVYGSVIPGIVPKETVKEVGNGSIVKQTHQRSQLRLIQTPQAFQRDILLQSYEYAYQTGFVGTDDASLVEHADFPIKVIEGLEENIKITTPMDWVLAELLVERFNTAPLITSFNKKSP